MKHYLDGNGREVQRVGTAQHPGDHEYFCAHHIGVHLVDVTNDPDQAAHRLRRHSDVDYACPLCDAEQWEVKRTEDGGKTEQTNRPAPLCASAACSASRQAGTPRGRL